MIFATVITQAIAVVVLAALAVFIPAAVRDLLKGDYEELD